MKFDNDLKEKVKQGMADNSVPMLCGEVGIGKSSWVEWLAKDMGTRCFTLSVNHLADKADLTGARLMPYNKEITRPDGTKEVVQDYRQCFFPHAVISAAIEYAQAHPDETPILFLDEINRTTADVTSECLSLSTMRSIGTDKLPDNLRIVVAGNDQGNITALDSASITRFVLLHVEPDVQTFFEHNPDLNPFIKNVLNMHPETIFCKKVAVAKTASTGNNNDDEDDEMSLEEILDSGEEMSQLTTPRTITALSRWMNRAGNAAMLNDLRSISTTFDGRQNVSRLQEMVEAYVGQTAFSIYLMEELVKNLMSASTAQANAPIIVKPASYDGMKACPDITALEGYIQNMKANHQEEELANCLVYALYEKEDNARLLSAISESIQGMTGNSAKTLMSLVVANQLDRDNVDALLSLNNDLARSLNTVLSFA